MDEQAVPGYTELKTLGAGGFGRVVLARHDTTGTMVAIKYLRVVVDAPDALGNTEVRVRTVAQQRDRLLGVAAEAVEPQLNTDGHRSITMRSSVDEPREKI